MANIDADLCVIGGGAGGLSVAAGAAQMGARTILVQAGPMGGDCLHFGCVPSKALLAAARAAAAVRDAGRFGIEAAPPRVDFARVQAHVRGVIAAIAPHDSVERFTGLGVTVIRATARFTAADRIEAGGDSIRARRFVIATGSIPAVPAIPGLDGVPYLTNETIFSVPDLPAHLLVIGGGPVGAELALAHRRLGSRVTLLEAARILPRDDPELVEVVRQRLLGEGIAIREGVAVAGAGREGDGILVTLQGGDRVAGSHLLVAAGRRAVVDGLDLAKAGVDFSAGGIVVDRRLRTTNRRIFALGDVVGGWQFTHMAGYQAGIVLRNALFRWPARVDDRAVPRVTYTDPELAQVGLSEAAARQAYGEVRVLRSAFAENDRARAERETEGMVKIVTGRRGRILGAGIVGAQAGELIQPWILAVGRGLGIGAMAGMIAPYPTLGEAGRRAAGDFYAPTLFGPRVRRLVRLLQRLG
ncbi:dihydrolipoamide dehydrogenase [Allostella vacuolata]|nr:dihydrolipoamide dehydrogenase [Stella vacuolata]